MDNQVPEQMWQPDVELHFLKEELRGKKLNLKDENDVEAYLQTNTDLPEKKRERMLRKIARIKKLRVDNERIKDKIKPVHEDEKPTKKIR